VILLYFMPSVYEISALMNGLISPELMNCAPTNHRQMAVESSHRINPRLSPMNLQVLRPCQVTLSLLQSSPLPDINKLIEAMLARTAKSSRPITPRAADRGERIERTTVTPRERPKPNRAGSTLTSQSVQRALLPGMRCC